MCLQRGRIDSPGPWLQCLLPSSIDPNHPGSGRERTRSRCQPLPAIAGCPPMPLKAPATGTALCWYNVRALCGQSPTIPSARASTIAHHPARCRCRTHTVRRRRIRRRCKVPISRPGAPAAGRSDFFLIASRGRASGAQRPSRLSLSSPLPSPPPARPDQQQTRPRRPA